MAVNFQLNRLKIAGFRGIPSLDIEIPTGVPLHLIGSNNSGKSTVLKAIAFAFKGGGFHQYDVEPFDFYMPPGGEHSKDFSLSVTFKAEKETQLPAVQGVGAPIFVHGVSAVGRMTNAGHMSKTFYLLGSQGEHIVISPRTPLKAEMKKELAQHGNVGWTNQNARHDDIRDHLPDVMLLTPQNSYQSLYIWKSGPLNRIASYLAQHLLEDKWTFSDHKMPNAIKKAHEFLAGAVENFPLWKETVQPALSMTLAAYIGKDTKLELRPTIQVIEQWMQQQLLLAFAADEFGTITPMQSMGDGWQSLVRLAALEVLSNLPSVAKERQILLYEEPETYLHPHLRRRLRNVLSDLASRGWVVVTTTHAPEFLSLSTNQNILKLHRSADKVDFALVDTARLSGALRLQSKIDERGSGEIFFANRVVLCEGRDDEFAIKAWLDKLSVETDSKSITVLGTGSRGNLPDYARLLTSLGTPWCAIVDEDRLPDGTFKPQSQQITQELRKACGQKDIYLEFETDLEHCYGIGRSAVKPSSAEHKATPDWQWNTIEKLNAADMLKVYPLMAKVVTTLQVWLN